MSSSDVFAVIMAGGSGTRFWPASRRAKPKQFLSVASDRPLIVETRERLEGLVPDENVLVVTGAVHADEVRRALPGLPAENVLVEPVGRNTLPCAAYAALAIRERSENAVHVVLPADHVIRPATDFRATLIAGIEACERHEAFVTLGIEPTHPATGYGYIQKGAKSDTVDGLPAYEVERFHEKPQLDAARDYLKSGDFLWNSGIFVWRSDSFFAGLAEHAPQLFDQVSGVSLEALTRGYAELPALSIDVGLMEKAPKRLVLPIDYQWDDVGSWSALFDVLPAGPNGHRRAGGVEVVSVDSSDCVVYGESGHVTALLGVEDLVVVRAGKVTLVCPRSRAEDVRRLVAETERIAPELL